MDSFKHELLELRQIQLINQKLITEFETVQDLDRLDKIKEMVDYLDYVNNFTTSVTETLSTKKIERKLLIKLNHELRTPLVPIKTYTDMLLSEKFGKLSDEQMTRIRVINSNIKQFEEVIANLLDQEKFDIIENEKENKANALHKTNELKQEMMLLSRVNTDLSDEVEKTKKYNTELKKNLEDGYHKIKETEQENLFVSKSAQDEQEKNFRLHKKHILTIASCIAIIGIMATAYSLFVVDLEGQQYRILNTGKINTGYVIQNLRGDTVNTWVSWRIADGSVIHVNLVNAKKYPGKLELVKETIISDEGIDIDDSLLHKGPQGSTSTYYVGWVGALKNASKTPTAFVIPTKFEVIESSGGQGEMTITLTDERNGDGYSGYTKSIVYDVQNQILKSDITIYEVDKLSDDNFKTILRHEFGHALGLGHSTAPEDLMAPIIQTDYPYISDCDIDALKSLYDGNQKSEVTCNK